jgi:hypothetical protein
MLPEELLRTIILDKKIDDNIEYVQIEGYPTVRKICNFEYAAIRSARVDELEKNAPHYLPPNYDIRGMTLGQIADAEMKLKLCPYKIFRKISQIDNVIYYDLVEVNSLPIMYFMNEKLA